MASTYSSSGIELIADGEQTGTWGDTTNTNLQIIDRMVNGVGTISLSGTTHTLTTSDGTLSDGHYSVLVFGGSPSGTNTVTLSPNNASHLYIVKNSSGQSVVLTQGSGGNVTIANGKSAVVYANGGGSGAAVVDVTSTISLAANSIGASELNVSGNGTTSQFLRSDGDGSFTWATPSNQTITLSGDLSGSGTTSINAQIAANVVGANELNVSGNGTTSQFLRSDADGSFTWATPTNQTITLSGDLSGSGTTSINAQIGSNVVGATELNVSGNGTAGQVLASDGDGTFSWTDVGGGFSPVSVSGTSQSLNLGSYNFFDAGTLTADTTLSFTSVPTNANWKYSFVPGVLSGYALGSGAYTGEEFTVGLQTDIPSDVFFKTDGTEMYVASDTSPFSVYQYSLSVPWNVSTASYTGSFNVSSQSSAPQSIFIKPDGTTMYVLDFFADIYQYTLSTAWDVTSASYASITKDVSAQFSNSRSIDFKSDGTVMYYMGNDKIVYQYNLSTAWNVSTASYASISKSLAAQDSSGCSARISSDGTKLLFTGASTDTVYSYTMSTAYNVSTASLDSDSFLYIAQANSANGMFVSSDGVHLYILNSATIDAVYHFLIADLTSLTLPASVENSLDAIRLNNRTTIEFFTTDGGTTVTLIGQEVQ